MPGADWTFRAVTVETWPDMATLFAGRGGPKHCWCMMWRSTLDGTSAPVAAEDRRTALHALVRAGRPVGLLGYDKAEAVAWCSLAPRGLFAKNTSSVEPQPGLWSLTCFFIRADHRKQAGFAALLAAAEAYAAQNGATQVEAYPVDHDSPSYRFSGFLPSFEGAGYSRIGAVGSRRYVVRKVLATS